MNTENTNTQKTSRLIGKVLSPAVRLWLKSQVQQISQLEVQIAGSDRQILTGNIPRVSILASKAVYQGLHLTQIQLEAKEIHINLGQVIKGKPLRLLDKVPVSGDLYLTQADLNASLASPLLADALTDLFFQLFKGSLGKQVSWQKVTIDSNLLSLEGLMGDRAIPIVFQAGLQLASDRELQILQPMVKMETGETISIDSFTVDLGAEVNIAKLNLDPGQILCSGRLNVLP
ncbi:LmeA family phospholipid-binding protein [Aliterella atlantica]|uniref:DUF2993 domain-containing protein n=1 Tax=Aliterella atlantica CENA595 TaxID=1618023 RepID=A0A0D8ZR99_9CYAN|nr:DUF2993 domain-containing protein [Aliterella atlantica]KJH69716.1 hypothetical protein UH38_22155 [Aliterella atlantica CENA595]